MGERDIYSHPSTGAPTAEYFKMVDRHIRAWEHRGEEQFPEDFPPTAGKATETTGDPEEQVMPATGSIDFKTSPGEDITGPEPIEVFTERRGDEIVSVFPKGIDLRRGQHIPF